MPYSIERPTAVTLRCVCGSFTAVGSEPSVIRMYDQHLAGYPQCPAATVAERHSIHYRGCNCLGDAAECCLADCPCHKADR